MRLCDDLFRCWFVCLCVFLFVWSCVCCSCLFFVRLFVKLFWFVCVCDVVSVFVWLSVCVTVW